MGDHLRAKCLLSEKFLRTWLLGQLNLFFILKNFFELTLTIS